ncbi:hypothetical protein ABA45_11800 [Marinobacter psychrophilus]|uniref:Uncharacterized protein n=1 Tax=Marinobacter psychrophilus TaxID=330734 RepID=A0A0H4I5J2_9GAMM|nr:hypothetical protein ABA45_11800 [Marinobacter psychrophilus]
MFFVQDDMQIVRPLSYNVLSEYGRIFERDDKILQIDPRFIRKEVRPEVNLVSVYEFSRNDYRGSHADVGIIKVDFLK